MAALQQTLTKPNADPSITKAALQRFQQLYIDHPKYQQYDDHTHFEIRNLGREYVEGECKKAKRIIRDNDLPLTAEVQYAYGDAFITVRFKA